MKILLTAFEPCGGDSVNPAQEAVALVANEIAGAQIVKIDVPVVFGKAIETVRAAMEKEQPDAVLCIGQAGGRVGLTPERVAINVDDGRIPDNEGNQPIDAPIFADGAPAYFATLPVKAMVQSIRDAGVPAGLSYTAGTFVCNHLLYGLLSWCAREAPRIRAGFMHVPYQHEQTVGKQNAPSLSGEDILKGVTATIGAIAKDA